MPNAVNRGVGDLFPAYKAFKSSQTWGLSGSRGNKNLRKSVVPATSSFGLWLARRTNKGISLRQDAGLLWQKQYRYTLSRSSWNSR